MLSRANERKPIMVTGKALAGRETRGIALEKSTRVLVKEPEHQDGMIRDSLIVPGHTHRKRSRVCNGNP